MTAAAAAMDAEEAGVAAGIAIVVAGVGALQLSCGLGLWRLRPHGRTLQLVFAWIGLLAFPIGTIISIQASDQGAVLRQAGHGAHTRRTGADYVGQPESGDEKRLHHRHDRGPRGQDRTRVVQRRPGRDASRDVFRSP